MLPLVSERKQSSMIGVGHGWMHGSVDESGFVGIQSTQHHWIPTRCEPGPELDFRFLSQNFTIPWIIKNWIAYTDMSHFSSMNSRKWDYLHYMVSIFPSCSTYFCAFSIPICESTLLLTPLKSYYQWQGRRKSSDKVEKLSEHKSHLFHHRWIALMKIDE